MKTLTMKQRMLAVAALIALVGSTAFWRSMAHAQGGAAAAQSSKGAVIKGKAPVNKNVLKVKLPKAREATLPNGLQVILLRTTRCRRLRRRW